MSDIFISQYWCRPADPSILFEDMLMQCVFYGWEILGESNKPGCINHFRNRGYENYLMSRPAFTHTEYSEKNQKEKWLPNTGNVDTGIRKTLVENMQSYVYQNIGINPVTEIMGNCPFNDTLSDLAKFDIEDWTRFDLTVSAMYAIIGKNAFVKQKVEYKAIQLFQKYGRDGQKIK